jgi:hypothetical protein
MTMSNVLELPVVIGGPLHLHPVPEAARDAAVYTPDVVSPHPDEGWTTVHYTWERVAFGSRAVRFLAPRGRGTALLDQLFDWLLGGALLWTDLMLTDPDEAARKTRESIERLHVVRRVA